MRQLAERWLTIDGHDLQEHIRPAELITATDGPTPPEFTLPAIAQTRRAELVLDHADRRGGSFFNG